MAQVVDLTHVASVEGAASPLYTGRFRELFCSVVAETAQPARECSGNRQVSEGAVTGVSIVVLSVLWRVPLRRATEHPWSAVRWRLCG